MFLPLHTHEAIAAISENLASAAPTLATLTAALAHTK